MVTLTFRGVYKDTERGRFCWGSLDRGAGGERKALLSGGGVGWQGGAGIIYDVVVPAPSRPPATTVRC